MMRIVTLGVFLFFCSFSLTAQKPVLKISPEFKLSKSRTFEGHLFSDATGHYMYFYDGDRSAFTGRSTVSSTILEKYDPTFKLVFSKEYKSDRKGVASLGMRYFNGQIVWLFSETNKKEDYIRYSILPLDMNGKQAKAQDIAKFKYENRDDIPTIQWNVSQDSSKLLFRAVSDENRDDEPFGVFISVLNKDMSVDWSRKNTFKYTEEQVDVLASLLKNDGSVYILAKVYEGKKAKESKKNDKKKSVAAYDITLFHFTKEDEKPREYRLQLGDSFIRGASLTTDRNDNLKCAGFYSNTKSGSLQGVFYLDLASDGSITASNKKEFTVADLKKFGEKNTDKDRTGDMGLEDSFKFSDFLVRDDGSAVVVAEENYVIVRTSYNGRTYSTTYEYNSRDIIIFTINTKGEIERVNAIPKYQVGINTDYFISYVSLLHGNEIVFFYNEDEDNMDKPVNNPKPKRVNNFKECIAVMTTLNTDGKLVRKQLFEARDVESLFVPKDSSPFEKNKLFFVSIKPKLFSKSNFHMGTVTLPE
ncbi:MAG: hypothetical protein IT262_03015 [Saprospiraceae bacterium]|nr:hypothetical protein [Saprospiraceae bacterium]